MEICVQLAKHAVSYVAVVNTITTVFYAPIYLYIAT